MRSSEHINDLAAALAKAQAAIESPPRNRTVKVSMKTGGSYEFAYATLDAIIDAVRKPLTDNGLWFTQTLANGEGGKYRLVTTLLHSSGQYVQSETPLLQTEAGNQAFGSALTYMRRYALTAMLGVAADEDDDGNAAEGNAAPHHERRGNGKQSLAQRREQRVQKPNGDGDVGDWKLNWPDGLVREFKQTAKGAHECLKAIRGAMGTNGDFLGFGDNRAVFTEIKGRAPESLQEIIAEIDDLARRPAVTDAG